MEILDIFFLERAAKELRSGIGASNERFVSDERSGEVVAISEVRIPHWQAFLVAEMDLVGTMALLRTKSGLLPVLFRNGTAITIGVRVDLDSPDASAYEVLDLPSVPPER